MQNNLKPKSERSFSINGASHIYPDHHKCIGQEKRWWLFKNLTDDGANGGNCQRAKPLILRQMAAVAKVYLFDEGTNSQPIKSRKTIKNARFC